MTLFWHRRDLRASDNRGLSAAADRDDGDVVPVFVFDPDVLEHGSDARMRFMLDSLAELRAAYREYGSDLVVAHGGPAEVLPALAAVDADAVHWNADYSGLAQARDERVEAALDAAAVDAGTIHDWPELTEEVRAELPADYPDSIVDHGERREQALAMFERARGEEPE